MVTKAEGNKNVAKNLYIVFVIVNVYVFAAEMIEKPKKAKVKHNFRGISLRYATTGS